MVKVFDLAIVTPEEEIFAAKVLKFFATGVLGELEVLYGHAPLLTKLAPGTVWIMDSEQKEQGFVIHGGMLEVQAKATTVLADACIRAEDIDMEAAIAAKDASEKVILGSQSNSIECQQSRSELYLAVAQLNLIKKIQSLNKKA